MTEFQQAIESGAIFAALSGIILLFLTFYPLYLMALNLTEGEKCKKRAKGLHCTHCGKRWKTLDD